MVSLAEIGKLQQICSIWQGETYPCCGYNIGRPIALPDGWPPATDHLQRVTQGHGKNTFFVLGCKNKFSRLKA
jgi:hypothetical protein